MSKRKPYIRELPRVSMAGWNNIFAISGISKC